MGQKKSPRIGFALGLYLVLALAFTALPSLKLGSFTKVAAPYELPYSVKPGEALILPQLEQVDKVKYGRLEFTRVDAQAKLLAFTSIYDGDAVRIHGQFKSEPRKDFWSHLLPGQHSYFETWLTLTPFKLERAPALKLSDETWKRVNQAAQETGQQERALMAKILSQGSPQLKAHSCFRLPLDSTVISGFGSPRTLPNGRKYHHTGIDLRARSPLKLMPMGEGQVVFADHMSVPGNMVVIDHGGYLHSRYMHLSQIEVKQGDLVDQKSLLGKTGSTGRITGPHLHWEVLWHGRAINPMALVNVWTDIKGCSIESETALPSYLAKTKELESILFDTEPISEQL